MNLDEILDFPYDPWLLLGVSRETDNDTVKTAWKRAGAPVTGVLAQAFSMLKDEPSRIRTMLLNPRPYSNAVDAESGIKKQPVFLGPGIWFDEIARRQRT
ncbi:MAG: hypothetical protein KAH21_12610 [Spirochaetaceae bacterium]|nr:hypothetical protein [Spirochaetaceae bacterium]